MFCTFQYIDLYVVKFNPKYFFLFYDAILGNIVLNSVFQLLITLCRFAIEY